jgi:catechol 2,3-dioxygenase-like lactoylglutathione lyase family enzyme
VNGTSAIKRVGHVGVAVEDLDRAVEFYEAFLQAKPFSEYTNERKPFIDELVGYQATMQEAWFELGDTYLELLQYLEPEPGRTSPETYNVGHMHLCLEVEDVEAEYERLRAADLGIEFRSEGPVTVPADEPDFGGDRYLYLRTPDGTTFELFQPADAAV